MAEPYQMIKSRSSLGWNLEGSQGSRQVPGKNVWTMAKAYQENQRLETSTTNVIKHIL